MNGTVKYANLWTRLLAFAADYMVMMIYTGVLFGVGTLFRFMTPSTMNNLVNDPLRGQIMGFLLMTLPVTLYFALLESSKWQTTWGKHIRHLKVMRPNGERLSFMRALARTLLKFIPWELAHTCIWQVRFSGPEVAPLITAGFILVWVLVGANIISLLLSSRRQTLYDRIVNSIVSGR